MSALTITHRAYQYPTDSAVFLAKFNVTSCQGDPLMENQIQDEIKAHLMATSDEFRTLAAEHSQLHKQLEALEAKSHLSEQEQVEEVRIKKQKLRLKDQMNAMLARSSRPQQVA
jgi:uncharacterized protein